VAVNLELVEEEGGGDVVEGMYLIQAIKGLPPALPAESGSSSILQGMQVDQKEGTLYPH
jgi:hypothetical protein